MRKIQVLLIASIVLLFCSMAIAGGSVFDLFGDPGPTKKATLSDTAQTLQAAYEGAGGTWLKSGNNQSPKAVLLTVETNGMRFGVGGTAPTAGAIGHVVAAGDSARLASPGYVSSMKVVNQSAGSNAVVQITPEY